MITSEEAFNVVVNNGFCGNCKWDFESKYCVECDCYQRVKYIRWALEKQVPKKPDLYGEESLFCPVCMASFGYASDYIEEMHRFNHCANCGQEIDWSEYIECIKNDSVK